MDSFTAIYGDAAAGALSYPMAPHLLSKEELEVIAGALQGWEIIGENMDPAQRAWSRLYGGGVVDGHLKLKLQSWIRNWVQPPARYVVHRPRLANGQWYRLFRTTMHVAEHVDQAMKDLQRLDERELVARYAHYLGVGARERCATFEQWWRATLMCLHQGDWHLVHYSPRWEAFVSPLVDVPRSSHLVDRCLAEFPPVDVHLYPGSYDGSGVWDLSEAVRTGAFVEVMGDLHDAPPYGNWGDGIQVPFGGGVAGRIIIGLIHHAPDRCQTFQVQPGSMGTVEFDAPNPGPLLQDVYAVTGWRPEGICRGAAIGQDPTGLNEAVLDLTQNFTRLIGIPGPVFHEAVLACPQLFPVYGRLISTFTHVDLEVAMNTG